MRRGSCADAGAVLPAFDSRLNGFDMARMPASEYRCRDVVPEGDAFGFQCFESPGAWSFPEHGHRGFCELVYVQRGTLRQRLDGAELTLGAGELVPVREGSHHVLQGSALSYCNLNIPIAEWRALVRFAGGAAMRPWLAGAGALRVPEPERPRFEGMLWDLLDRASAADGPSRLRAFLAHAVAVAQPASRSEPGRAPSPDWLRALTAEVDLRLGEDLRPATLARRAGCSPAHLARTFRAHLGCTPTEWVVAARLRRGALWLSRTNRPIADICFALGFGSLTYFYRRFRAAYGVTPLAWRRSRTPRPWREGERAQATSLPP